ncbi:SRPBCC family protein [Gracilibacillus dipsosauri]|uniref:Polyketide cyclase n=1 Tax=Gracilibacillus dipsosauri TaxID=178340 RepID=A0A317L0U6_9BACI|nr:SRPBCC family protein [Gracilibacillus dipsosauri]PWU69223.1 polyketide cyclase [Gracilibacillus dipsosauri]
MTERFVTHDTFIIDRTLEVPNEQVFKAWSTPELKAQWFAKADQFNFQVGGKETNHGGPPEGPVFHFEATYQEIVPNERIIYSYTMDQGENRISVSTVTVEFNATETGTHLIYTEQGTYVDGHDKPEIREHGTGIMLDKLVKLMKGEG